MSRWNYTCLVVTMCVLAIYAVFFAGQHRWGMALENLACMAPQVYVLWRNAPR